MNPLLAGPVFVALVAAPASVHVRVTGRLTPERFDGVAELRVPAELCPGERRLVLYPQRLGQPASWSDVNHFWFYPSAVSLGDLTVLEGAPSREGPLPDGVLTLRLRYRVDVPERFGAFGRVGQGLTLTFGLHPLVGCGAGLAPSEVDFDLSVPEGVGGLAGPVVVPARGERRVRGNVRGRHGLQVVLGAEPSHHTHAGLHVLRFRAGAPAAVPELTDPLDTDWLLQVERSAGLARTQVAALGLPADARLNVVLAPLRRFVAQVVGEVVLVSDWAFTLFPAEILLKFHRLELVRAFCRALLEPTLAEREAPADVDWVGELLAAHLAERARAILYPGEPDGARLLAPFAFVREVDSLLYAPELPLAHAYFWALDEGREPSDAFAPGDAGTPRGRLMWMRLVERYGEAQVDAWVSTYAHARVPLRALLGPQAQAYLQQWQRRLPEVDYRLGAVERAGAATRVGVTREGPDADGLDEPVTVAAGACRTVVQVSARAAEALLPCAVDADEVELDPEHHLLETPAREGEHPRAANAGEQPWTFVLNNLFTLVGLTEGSLLAAASFRLQERYDLSQRVWLDALWSPERASLSGRWERGFGPRRTPNSLTHHLGLGLAADLQRDFAGAAGGAALVRGALTYGYDTRATPWRPLSGVGLTAALRGGLGLTGEDRAQYVSLGLGGLAVFSPHPRHTLVARGRADVAFGEVPAQQRFKRGGAFAARGFPDEGDVGQRRLLSSLEYRHGYTQDLRESLLALAWLTGIDGVAFVDAGFLGGGDDGWAPFVSAGYGLRLYLHHLGINPGLISLDLARPLLGRTAEPWALYLSFTQSLTVF